MREERLEMRETRDERRDERLEDERLERRRKRSADYRILQCQSVQSFGNWLIGYR